MNNKSGNVSRLLENLCFKMQGEGGGDEDANRW